MKNLCALFSFILSLVTFCCAQTYIPLPTENAVWTEHVYDEISGYSSSDYYTYFFKGDTVILGTQYKKLYSGAVFSTAVMPPFYIAAIRQDTVSRKVYALMFDSTNEAIMYDFDLNVGDPLKYIAPPEYLGSLFSGQAPIVTAIDTVYISNIPHRRFLYQFGVVTNPINNYPDAIIEGFGNTRGFIFAKPDYPVTGFHHYRNTECLSIEQQTFFQPGTICCQSGDSCLISTGISDTEVDLPELYYYSENGSGILSIRNPSSLKLTLTIYNVLGQKGREIPVQSSLNISVQNKTPSYHLAVLTCNNKVLHALKY